MLAPTSLLCLLLTAAAQFIDLGSLQAIVEADQIAVDGPRQCVELRGNAVLRVGETVFKGDWLSFRYGGEIGFAATAEGHVLLDDPRLGRLTGDRLHYDFHVDRGEAVGVRVTIPLIVRPGLDELLSPAETPRQFCLEAASLSRDGRYIRARDVFASASESTPPQYCFRAGQLDVKAGGSGFIEGLSRIHLKDASLQVYGATLLGLGELTLGEGGLFFPHMGVNGTYGLFVEHTFSPLPFRIRPAKFNVTARLGTSTFLSGRARFAYPIGVGQIEAIGSLTDRRLLVDQARAVQFNRVPELAWKLPTTELPGVGGQLTARASWGQYDEEGTARLWRTGLEANYRRPLHRGRTSTASLELGGAYHWYDGGREFGWLLAGGFIEKQFDHRLYLGLGLRSIFETGATPFLFDSNEFHHELNATARVRLTRHWLLGSKHWIELDGGLVRSEEYRLAFRDRAIEYGLNLMVRPRVEVGADVKLLGF